MATTFANGNDLPGHVRTKKQSEFCNFSVQATQLSYCYLASLKGQNC